MDKILSEKFCLNTFDENDIRHAIEVDCTKSNDTPCRNVLQNWDSVLCTSAQSHAQGVRRAEIICKNDAEASQGSTEDCLAMQNSDGGGVVDVSPSGYSMSALELSSEKESRILSQAEKMYVFDNTFTILPAPLGKFKNLKILKFFSNELKVLPDEVSNLVHLEHLQMKVHPTGLGSLPPLGNLNFLKVLELHQAPLRPSVFSLPGDISKLHMLKRLAICNFSISFLPPEIGNLRNLEDLDLSFNRLKILPKEVSGLQELRCLRIENNKLMELPIELTSLQNLITINVSHNRLTSLEPLGLSTMTSLRFLDAKFNKVHNSGHIPDWITCNLEGNCLTSSQITSSSEDDAVDSEFLPFAGEDFDQGGDMARQIPTFSAGKEKIQKNLWHVRRRGWKRFENHQQLARLDRLNFSRKSRADGMEELKVGESDEIKAGSCDVTDVLVHSEDVSCDVNKRLENSSREGIHSEIDVLGDTGERLDNSCRQERCSTDDIESDSRIPGSDQKNPCTITVSGYLDDDCNRPANCGSVIDSHSSREVISGDICFKASNSESSKIITSKDTCDQPSGNEKSNGLLEGKGDTNAENFPLKLKEKWEFRTENGRRKCPSSEKDTAPTKRRKSVQAFSEASFAYHSQSVCGFGDVLQDGFYDTGRESSFLPLDLLETQELCLDGREVILVDRMRDEELDAIVLLAQQFISSIELAGLALDESRNYQLSTFQKAAILALFVSDCFGGSDRTLNVINTRRAVLGGTSGAPFLCSCSSSSDSMRISTLSVSSTGFPGCAPTLDTLCKGAIRNLKMQRGSNVVLLGSLPYGICRHRAILFKYLCDRVSVPCELVRGYLDYMPHAWNIVFVSKGGASVRMLVDACRPLDIREERDPEYFCRYIPLKRVHIPPSVISDAMLLGSEEVYQLLHGEIGRGASGSIIQQCRLGSVMVAAKVHSLNQTSDATYQDIVSKCLGELRIFCSLGEHPCIVSLYGHQFSPAPIISNDCNEGMQVQLVIFMEYISGGSLEKIILNWRDEGRIHAPARQALYVARDIAHALSFLHSKHILHRDIKSSNVLVDFEGNKSDGMPLVKLCDFDSAVSLLSSCSHNCYVAHRGVPPADVCVGTPCWMAPEVLKAMYGQHPYGLEADIWSFGCLLFELLTLQVPYFGFSDSDIHSFLQRGERPQLPSELRRVISQNIQDSNASASMNLPHLSHDEVEMLKVLVRLFKSCTESNPSDRPTALEVFTNLSAIMNEKSGAEVKFPFDNESALGTELSMPTPGLEYSEDRSTENGIPLDACKLYNCRNHRCDDGSLDSCAEEPETSRIER
eukprot:c28834_g1_i1 orf=729-4661(+)